MSAALHEIQQTLHEVFRGRMEPEAAAGRLGVRADRLAIYQRFVRGHILRTLAKDYPMTRSLLGEELWGPLAERYFAEYPPQSWELNAAVQAFPEFLERVRVEEGPKGLTPLAAQLAQFEWEIFAAFTHPARIPGAETLERPVVNPTLSVLSFDYPLVRWYASWDQGEVEDVPASAPEALPEGETVLFYRSPTTLRTNYRVATDDYLFALKVTHEGLSLEAAAQATGQPLDLCRSALDAAVEAGLVITPVH
ncbi:MAG: hypothetical protein D6729_14600 [Deltaproteobacteria bacterium]|nr:MAG: hypothetical protein D6729_14600 [Deltaproteobacteria bacterium]